MTMSLIGSIQEFFNNQTIFITNGRRFIGKLIIERLLHVCELKKIIILVRDKKNKIRQQRFRKFFKNPCFGKLKSKNLRKVQLVSGDCGEPMLGLNQSDMHLIQNEVTCIIHDAANVRFDQGFRSMFNTNVRSVQDMLKLAQGTTQLRAFVYVSKGLSNCPQKNKRFHLPPTDSEKLFALINIVDDELLELITPNLLNEYPNTYVYTKSIAEDLMMKDVFVPNKIIVRIRSGATDQVVDNILGSACNAESTSKELEMNGTWNNRQEIAIFNCTGSEDDFLNWNESYSNRFIYLQTVSEVKARSETRRGSKVLA